MALSTAADLNLPALFREADYKKLLDLKKLLEETMKLAKAYKSNKSTQINTEEYITYLKDTDLMTLRIKAIKLNQKTLDKLLSDLSDSKNAYESDHNNILSFAIKALKYYEKEIKDCLQNSSILETLVADAHEAKLIPKKVKNILTSVECNSLKCSYLMLHVNKKIAESHIFFDAWLNLLCRCKGISCVLEKVKIYYDESIQASHDATPDFEDEHVSDLTELFIIIRENNWKKIAIVLGLPHDEIIRIESMNNNCEVSINRVLQAWVTQKYIPPTAETLEDALHKLELPKDYDDKKKVLELKTKFLSGCISDVTSNVKILFQSQSTNVHEGGNVLLRVEVSSSSEASLTYQWYKDGKKLNDDHNYYGSKDCIINIFADSLLVEGSYKCRIQDNLDSKPIVLTIETPLDQYREKLNDIYMDKPEVPKDTWPPVSIHTYINLALIKQQDILYKEGEYACCTIQKDADGIFKNNERIKYEDAFDNIGSGARLLIEGRPGSGKTTLVHKVSQSWSKDELKFGHVKLLFFVHLRGFLSNPTIELRNILECYFSRSNSALKDIIKYAHKHNGLGLCFILDGLDEYLPMKKDTYIHKLIKKSELPKAVVIVASRPFAVANFRSSATRQIEVLGFLKEQIDEYIKQYFSKDVSKCSELLQYLDHHPNVHHMCYFPIHTAMVCFLHQNGRSLPVTETGIYSEFTIYFFLRTLLKDEENEENEENIYIEFIHSLPSPANLQYLKVCKLAFETILSKTQVMNEEKVKKYFNVHSEKDYFGLISVDKIALAHGFQKLYTFLHLTFQEFLAAYHVSKLEEDEQTKLIDKYGNAKEMQVVWKFYCGLVKFDNHVKFDSLLEKTQCGMLYKVQCSFESQQPSTCYSIIKDGSLSFKNEFLTPSDFTAIAFIISHAAQGTISKLVFNKCTLTQEGINILEEKAGDNLSFVTTLCFHGDSNSISAKELLKNFKHLTTLDLSRNSFGFLTLAALKYCPSLITLNLSSNSIGGSGAMGFAKNLNFTSLTTLDLSNNSFDTHGAFAVADALKNCPSLTKLYLSGNSIGNDGAFAVADALKNIIKLDLSSNSIGSGGAFAVADALKNCPSIIKLDLSSNSIGSGGAFAVADALKNCPSIIKLDLSSNSIGSGGAFALAGALKNCPSIIKLDLSSNSIGNGGALALAGALKKNCPSITKLNLSYNVIGISGAEALGDIRRSLALDLSGNLISKKFAKELADPQAYYRTKQHNVITFWEKFTTMSCFALKYFLIIICLMMIGLIIVILYNSEDDYGSLFHHNRFLCDNKACYSEHDYTALFCRNYYTSFCDNKVCYFDLIPECASSSLYLILGSPAPWWWL